MQFHLAHGVAINRKHPTTFLVPSRAAKKAIVEGDLVKIFIKFGPSHKPEKVKGLEGERCWVRVLSANYPEFVGMLDTIPQTMPDLEHEIAFRGENIIDIYSEE
jgi:hypothetical protein